MNLKKSPKRSGASQYLQYKMEKKILLILKQPTDSSKRVNEHKSSEKKLLFEKI